MDKLKLLEKKHEIQQQYINSIETAQYNRATLIRGKLLLIDELIKDCE